MKYLFSLVCLLTAQLVSAQCADCYSLESAMKDPLMVKKLHLSNKALSEIPQEIAKMQNLEYLDLSNNLIGGIESALDSNFKLKHLDLSFNKGFSTFRISEFFTENSMIEEINLRACGIRNLNYELRNLQALHTLSLSKNNLEFIPEEISQARSLKYLDLSDNRLKKADMSFANLWNIEYLVISSNDSLALEPLMGNLQHKNNLKTLVFSPKILSKHMANSLNSTGIENLIFKDTEILELSNSLRKNETLKSITFINCSFQKPSKVYNVLSGIKSVTDLAYEYTPVYEEQKLMKQLENLSITNSEVENPDELADAKLKKIDWSDTDRDLLAETQLISGKNPEVLVTNNRIPVSEDMLKNQLRPIVEVPVQTEIINSSQETMLEFEDTKCLIPENAFLNKDGSVYEGEVRIEVKEYFDPLTNALSGAPMMANSNAGPEVFTSNGMIDFNASTADGQQLSIDPQKTIQVSITNLQPQANSNLYRFDPSANTWMEIGQPIALNRDSIYQTILDSLNLLSDDNFVFFTRLTPNYNVEFQRKRNDPYEIDFSYSRDFLKTPNFKSRAGQIMYKDNELEGNELAKQKWYLDTLVSDELDSLFKSMNREQRKAARYEFQYYSSPRLVQNIRIEPDFVNDNFRMTFQYKGQEMNLPVYQKQSQNTIKELKYQQNFFTKYQKIARREDAKERKPEEKRKKIKVEMAQEARKQRAEFLTQIQMMPNFTNFPVPSSTLEFGINATGLFNCDYFYRNVPDYVVDLGDSLTDMDGISVATGKDVRMVIVKDNACFGVNPENVPLYKNRDCMLIIVLNENEIAVIKTWDHSKKFTYKAKRISTNGKTPEDIKKEIYGS